MTWVHIVGGGVAGLSLAEALSRFGNLPGKVIISDPVYGTREDRTYSFWSKNNHVDDFPKANRYSRWLFSAEDKIIPHHGVQWHYYRISGKEFFQRRLSSIEQHPQIEFRQERLTSPPDAAHVFDSRPPEEKFFLACQSFVGMEWQCNHGLNLETALLMTNMRYDSLGLIFEYILPISKNKVLVESTFFGRGSGNLTQLRENVVEWINSRGLTGTIIRREQAHIPMGIKPNIEDSWGQPIGARGGMTRASSGYGWLRISEWASMAAAQLITKNHVKRYQNPRLETWMDRQLLKIIKTKPHSLPKLFLAIAQNTSGDDFASFLTRATLASSARMVWDCPFRPFLLSTIGRADLIQ
tara:strand:+ start:3172 stop:4233 length:1062 start_codon:yes stop_codon:yes gene_type:complete